MIVIKAIENNNSFVFNSWAPDFFAIPIFDSIYNFAYGIIIITVFNNIISNIASHVALIITNLKTTVILANKSWQIITPILNFI